MYNKEDYINDLKDYIQEKQEIILFLDDSIQKVKKAYEESDKTEYFKKSRDYVLKTLKEELKTDKRIIKILEEHLEKEK
jgi:predicted RNase H-like nuclease (RuvC/YqgF family)